MLRRSFLLSTLGLGMASVSHAFSLGNVTGGGSSSGVSQELLDKQTELQGQFGGVTYKLVQAQVRLTKALGGQGVDLSPYASGNTDVESAEKLVAISKDLAQKNLAVMKSDQKFTAKQKKEIAEACKDYAVGLLGTLAVFVGIMKLAVDVTKAIKGAGVSGALTVKSKLAFLVALCPLIPKLLKLHVDFMQAATSWGKKNGVEMKAIAKASVKAQEGLNAGDFA